jgi:transketolase
MNIKLAKENIPEEIEMRSAYTDTLIELAKDDKNIIALDCDLMGAMGTAKFRDKFPDQTINCGIQEANMYGVAAGMSLVGKIPFAHTFGVFSARRSCDQIYESCCYPKLNVKVVGSDPGITAQINGGTHMPFEDLGIMRSFPTMTVVEPTDSTAMRAIVRIAAATYGNFYLRLVRKNVVKIYEEGSVFEIGKAVPLRDGKDVTLIAMGLCVAESILAAKILEKKGISARVIDMLTIKPLDVDAIIDSAKETGAIVTAENHFIATGLGAAVSSAVSQNYPVPVEIVGVADRFGEVGKLDYLKTVFGLTAENIAEAAEKAIARKTES